jgi:hypothetical protein
MFLHNVLDEVEDKELLGSKINVRNDPHDVQELSVHNHPLCVHPFHMNIKTLSPKRG